MSHPGPVADRSPGTARSGSAGRGRETDRAHSGEVTHVTGPVNLVRDRVVVVAAHTQLAGAASRRKQSFDRRASTLVLGIVSAAQEGRFITHPAAVDWRTR